MTESRAIADSLLAAIGARIAELREARSMSVADLAKNAGVARGYVWRAENGKLNPNATTLAKFADGLGVTMSELLAGIEVDPGGIPKRPFGWRSADGTDPRPKRGAGGTGGPAEG